MKTDQAILRNNRGSALLMGLGMIVLASTMTIGVTLMANKEANQRRYERDSKAVKEINAGVQNLLSDQRFCSDIVKSKYSTTNNVKIPFTMSSLNSGSSYSSRSRKILESYQKDIEIRHGYEVDAIELNNMKESTPQGQASERIKTFDVTVHLKKIKNKGGIFDKVSFGITGVNKNNKLDHIALAFTEKTGLCTAYKKILAESSIDGNKSLIDACKALGGSIDPSTFVCKLESFSEVASNRGVLDYSGKNPSLNLSDALCEMEKNLLRKMRRPTVSWGKPHPISGKTYSSSPSNEKNWTNFCKKPEWGGCHFTRKHSSVPSEYVQYEHGDDRYYLQGEKVVRTEKLKAKKLSSTLKTYNDQAMSRRVARLYMTPPAMSGPDFHIKIKQQINRNGAAIGNIVAGGLGAMAWGANGAFSKDNLEFGLGVTAANFLAISAFGLGPGLAIVAIVLAFGPKCDNAWIETTYVCKDGYMEKEKFRYHTERPKKSTAFFTCTAKGKWTSLRDPKTGKEVATEDADIVSMVKQIHKTDGKSLSSINKAVFDTSSYNKNIILEDMSAFEDGIINDIKKASSLAELMTEESSSVDDTVPDDGTFHSQKIINEYLKKEADLIQAQKVKIDSLNQQINDLAAEARATGASYEHIQSKKIELIYKLNSLLSELSAYNKFQALVKTQGLDTKSVQDQMISLTHLDVLLRSINI